jgi:hypothetical protein
MSDQARTNDEETRMALGGGLEYAETPPAAVQDRPYRVCRLFAAGTDTAVSSVDLFPLRVRFGAAVIEAEGLGGVQTLPEHRGKGYIRLLLETALAGARGRVDAAFLFGIEGLYGKFGFAACLADSSFTVWVRRLTGQRFTRPFTAAGFTADDAAECAALFNAEHACRPWTLERSAEAMRRPRHPEVWRPLHETITVREEGRLAGYAIVEGELYGHVKRTCTVHEAAAADCEAARFLLDVLSARCWARHVAELTVMEPLDSTVGTAARQLGCEARRSYAPDGGGMAAILSRESLLRKLAPELDRRQRAGSGGGADPRPPAVGGAEPVPQPPAARAAFDDLLSRRAVPDDGELARLLLGFHSWSDAERLGVPSPQAHGAVYSVWFPGERPPVLPAAYAHMADRY